MNAKTHTIKLTLQPKEVYEAVSGLLHTLLFYRSSAVGECETTLHTGETEMMNFDCVKGTWTRFNYVQVRSVELENAVRHSTNLFFSELKRSDMQRGCLRVEFFEKSMELFMAKPQTWEVWRIEVKLAIMACGLDEIEHTYELRDALADAVILMSNTVASSGYVPIATSPEDIPRVYDTSFAGIQTYHFKISHKIDFQGRRSNVFTDLQKWIQRRAYLF